MENEIDNNEPSDLQKRLKRFIKKMGLSDMEFTESIGKVDGYVNKVMDNLHKKTKDNIIKAYPNLNIGWLLSGEGEMEKDEKYITHLKIVPKIENTTDESVNDKDEKKTSGDYTLFSQSEMGKEAFTVIKSLSKSNETLSDATKVMADNVKDLVVMVKLFVPANSDTQTDNYQVDKVASKMMEIIAHGGAGDLWPTKDEGMLKLGTFLGEFLKLKQS